MLFLRQKKHFCLTSVIEISPIMYSQIIQSHTFVFYFIFTFFLLFLTFTNYRNSSCICLCFSIVNFPSKLLYASKIPSKGARPGICDLNIIYARSKNKNNTKIRQMVMVLWSSGNASGWMSSHIVCILFVLRIYSSYISFYCGNIKKWNWN